MKASAKNGQALLRMVELIEESKLAADELVDVLGLALGAGRANVLWLVMRESLTLAAVGLAIGLPAALAGGWLVSRLLFGIKPADSASVIVAAILLLACVALAGFFPARRASSLDPTVALRNE